jgi:drug/metabolite transporter (DMT)-like permease
MMMQSRRTELLADLGLFYAAVIWGATFVVVQWALDGVDAVTMVGYRFLIAGGLLLVYLALRGKSLSIGWPRALWLATILWSLYASQTIGLNYTTTSNSGFITGLFVVFVPIFLITIFKRRPTIWEIIATVISLGGLWILTGGLRQLNTGDALTLISAMTYALHLLYSDKYMKAGADPLLISCQQFLLVGAFSLVFGWITGRSFTVTPAALGWTIFLALFPTLSAFVIQMFAQRFTSPLRVSLIFAFEPVFAAVFAWTIGGELFAWKSAFGGILIFAGLVISGVGAKPTESSDK